MQSNIHTGNTTENAVALFDASSARFAGSIDQSIQSGQYRRGTLFVEAISRLCPHDAVVLDYGCGPGRITAMLAAEGFRVVGLDPSAGMIAEARLLGLDPAKAVFDVVDDDGDSLVEAQFAAVVCSSVIEFAQDPAAMLRMLHRTLVPGGVIAISYSNRRSLWRAFVRWCLARQNPHHHVQLNIYRFAQIRTLLQACGFEAISQPVFYECAPADRRGWLKQLSGSVFVGTLGLVTARRKASGA